MIVTILESAESDLLAGYEFYEHQQKGLGVYFLDSLFSDIDSLTLFASIHPVYFDRYHRLLAKRFPFAVYYQVRGETAVVYAVLDCRMSPDSTMDRLIHNDG